jgi:hypothetical protein
MREVIPYLCIHCHEFVPLPEGTEMASLTLCRKCYERMKVEEDHVEGLHEDETNPFCDYCTGRRS